jgi:hypothetical protein
LVAGAVDQAGAWNPAPAEAHAVKAVERMFNWNWAAAKRELGRTLNLNPSSAGARHWVSHDFVLTGDFACSLQKASGRWHSIRSI